MSLSDLTPYTLLSDLSPEELETLRGAWEQWGMDSQLNILEEEISELGESIVLAHLEGYHWSGNVFEEIADVLICLSQVEIHLREYPTNREGTQTLWMQVEAHAAETKVESINPDDLLLLHALKTVKAFAKTRRYDDSGTLRNWSHILISELGGLLAALLRADEYLRGIRPWCSHWDRVMEHRDFKLARLRDRLAEAQGGSS